MNKWSNINGMLSNKNSFIKRNSPTILTCISAVGVLVTTVLAVKSTPKAVELIKRDSRINHDGDPYAFTKKEVVQSCWKCYIPTTVIGLSTILCIFGANVLNKRSQASLVSAYSLLNESYQKYRKAAKKVYGEDADSKISAQAAKDIYVSADGYHTYDPNIDESEKILFFDNYSGRYFTSTMASVINAQYHFNRNLALRGDAYLNEFYTFLGIEPIDRGEVFGWSIDDLMAGGVMWLDFENRLVTMDDGMECYIVSALWDPIDLLLLEEE